MKHPTGPLSIGLGVGLAIGLIVATFASLPIGQAQSREPDKTLRLLFGHTGEKGEFTFKRNGSYDRSELARLNHFLRDWRRNEDARMDPHLLDLVWAIYQKTGSRDYIHVVSAYRSPATNEMLRRRSSGVAKNSQHRLGKAMDWYLTDVPLAKLRATAMKMQGGGVGYYPRSGSPFVHTDTGNVRAWPRMTRQQLIALFPDGNTLHLPSDGPPLPGYQLALARKSSAGSTALAYLDTGATEAEDTDRTGTASSSSSWLRRVFPAGGKTSAVADATPAAAPANDDEQVADASADDEEADATRPPRARPADAAETSAPAEESATIVASIDPADASDASASAPLPRARPAEPGAEESSIDGQDAIASLTERMNQDYPDAPADPAGPIALAFAAASDSPQPSAADRAILTAFASLRGSNAVRDAEPELTAALTLLASNREAGVTKVENPAPSRAATRSVYDEPAIITAGVAEPTTGTVLAPEEPARYGGDEPNLVKLIDVPQPTPSSGDGQLAMPAPATGLYVPPEGASEVADLRGRSGPPVDRFARSGEAPSEQSFFSRLFASLVE